MNPLEKEFVPYPEAFELKQLGFDEEGLGTYSESGQVLPLKAYTSESKAILFSQAFRWFREKHDLQYWLRDGGYIGKVFIKITGYKHDKFYF